MRTLILFTSEKTTKNKCEAPLISYFSTLQVNSNNETLISLGTPYKNFNFYYSGDSKLNDDLTFEQKEKNNVPLNNPYCSILEFHKTKIVYDVLLLLNKIYPELYIYYDEECWFGTPSEFKSFVS